VGVAIVLVEDVLSQRPVVVLGGRVGIDVLSQTEIGVEVVLSQRAVVVAFAERAVGSDVFSHIDVGRVAFKDRKAGCVEFGQRIPVVLVVATKIGMVVEFSQRAVLLAGSVVGMDVLSHRVGLVLFGCTIVSVEDAEVTLGQRTAVPLLRPPVIFALADTAPVDSRIGEKVPVVVIADALPNRTDVALLASWGTTDDEFIQRGASEMVTVVVWKTCTVGVWKCDNDAELLGEARLFELVLGTVDVLTPEDSTRLVDSVVRLTVLLLFRGDELDRAALLVTRPAVTVPFRIELVLLARNGGSVIVLPAIVFTAVEVLVVVFAAAVAVRGTPRQEQADENASFEEHAIA